MAFQVTARTILHLGAELISSDGVALYELVKNAFDADSERVDIDITVRIPYLALMHFINQASNEGSFEGNNSRDIVSISTFKQRVLESIDPTAPAAKEMQNAIKDAKNWSNLIKILKESNSIIISDSGEGMSLSVLNDVFLTIGTRSRLMQRDLNTKTINSRPLLGEKGIGRLSAMRLGSQLHIETTKIGEQNWNVLDIDWSLFTHASDALINEIKVEPRIGSIKENTKISGTKIKISGLNSEWSLQRLKTLAIQEFSKITDPFQDELVFPIFLKFNNELIVIPRFDELLLKNAHAIVKARFEREKNGEMRLSGFVEYKNHQKNFVIEGAHLISLTKESYETFKAKQVNSYISSSEGIERRRLLESLGPFNLDIYWFNRRILKEIEGIGDRKTVASLVRAWAGGVMVFRDGFRVLPYGDLTDDWLDLDRTALGAPGYKVNRAQLIGRLLISSKLNPELMDQSNREGLRDSAEKRILVALLQYILQVELRSFLDATDKEIKAQEPVLFEELENRVEKEEKQLLNNLDELARRVPEIEKEGNLFNRVKASSSHLREIMNEVQILAAEYDQGRKQLLNLAGVGLTVEVLAHELNRATEHALLTLNSLQQSNSTVTKEALVRTLQVQLKTLQKRLSILDDLSTAKRQRKEKFDLANLIRETLESHKDQLEQEQISSSFEIIPTNSKQIIVTAVKGMVVQVLENLIVNSIYWLRQLREIEPNHQSKLTVTIDTFSKELRVTDNGPGVRPDMKDRIFEAFVSTKPPGQGKGLGLFIAREIAKYHGEDVFLTNEPTKTNGNFNTFVLTLGSIFL